MNRNVAQGLMANVGWLSRQPEDFRAEVLRRSLFKNYDVGKVIFDIGDQAGGVFGLVAGALEMVLPNGHIGTMAAPGLWFGEGSALRKDKRVLAVVAKSEASLFYLPLHEFDQLIANASYCRSFMLLTYEHVEDAIRIVASLTTNDVLKRLSSRLLSLSIADARGGRELALTQSDLASMCRLSRQSVSASCRVLVDEGVIAWRYGKVVVLNTEKLRNLASIDEHPEPH
jgi:CRP/FNR family transcriptional regulator, cyclic AMP receptor protein